MELEETRLKMPCNLRVRFWKSVYTTPAPVQEVSFVAGELKNPFLHASFGWIGECVPQFTLQKPHLNFHWR